MDLLQDDQLLNERYRLDQRLGQGGMGTVYRAWDTLLERHVAIKVVTASELGSEGRSRLLQEARAAAALNHPHIVAIYDVAEADGSPFIVMELVEGVTLDQYACEDLESALDALEQVASALATAHQHGIIHRDLKPENILVNAAGQVKLTDFGLARITGKARLTQEGTFMGTFAYMAPELILGREATAASDLYAFGIIAYELLAGQPPYRGDNPTAILSQHLHAPVVPPSAYNELLPVAFDQLALRLLAKEPEERPDSVTVLESLTGVRQELHIPGFTWEAERNTPQAFLSRLVRGRMVGREDEFAQAATIWREAASGSGQVLLVSGEPGIGKTRFARELTTYAEIGGALALAGVCYGSGAAPYTPFSQMIRGVLQNGLAPELPEAVTADLLSLAPDLRYHHPDLVVASRPSVEANQASLFDSVYALCQILAARQPLLLLVDDLHWADSGSANLLRHLARRASSLPMLILATYREVELSERRPTRQVLQDLNRERLATRIKIGRLDREQTGQLLETLFAEEITPEFLDSIYRETEGNPFFIEEVCRSLIERGAVYFADGHWNRPEIGYLEIPQGIQLAIESRLEHLSSGQLEILQVAALIGRDFAFDLLAVAAGAGEETLIETLEDAERYQLVEELPRYGRLGGSPMFSFTHALIQSALLATLSTLRRQRLQIKVAQALEEAFPERLSQLAPLLGRYFAEAGEGGKAVHYLIQVGDAARKIYSDSEAAEAYEQALIFLRDGDQTQKRADTLMKLGQVYHNLSEFERSRQAYEEAFSLDQEGQKSDQAELPPASRAFHFNLPSIITLDPSFISDSESGIVAQQLFSGLIEPNAEGELRPDVAWRWELHDGGRRYVFHLRDDVTWSDGRPVTADDFALGFRRAIEPGRDTSPANLLFDIRGAQAYFNNELTDLDAVGIRVHNEHTLEIELEAPIAYFLYILTTPVAMPVPRHVIERYGDDWTAPEHLVTNGPWRLKNWRPGESLTLIRNSTYHQPWPGNLREAVMIFDRRIDPGGDFMHDELDAIMVGKLSLDNALKLMRRWTGSAPSSPFTGTQYYWFDVRQEPFDDPQVRRAFAHATDRRALAELTFKGIWLPASGGVVPPGIPGHVPDVSAGFNPDLARQLLAQAGFPGGRGFPTVTIVATGEWFIRQMIGELQRQWREVLGVEVVMNDEKLGDFRRRYLANPPEMWHLFWAADYPDPDNFMRLASWRSISNWDHLEYDELIEEARHESDRSRRWAQYRRAETILAQEAPVVPLAYVRWPVLAKPWVKLLPLIHTSINLRRVIMTDREEN